mmetsp:Transcript_4099/g.9104  ORF Transcript_4099/g.9104 Transcript_4099/m.9104 type:complete len:484 (+) Transcript_4099:599-2050(+)
MRKPAHHLVRVGHQLGFPRAHVRPAGHRVQPRQEAPAQRRRPAPLRVGHLAHLFTRNAAQDPLNPKLPHEVVAVRVHAAGVGVVLGAVPEEAAGRLTTAPGLTDLLLHGLISRLKLHINEIRHVADHLPLHQLKRRRHKLISALRRDDLPRLRAHRRPLPAVGNAVAGVEPEVQGVRRPRVVQGQGLHHDLLSVAGGLGGDVGGRAGGGVQLAQGARAAGGLLGEVLLQANLNLSPELKIPRIRLHNIPPRQSGPQHVAPILAALHLRVLRRQVLHQVQGGLGARPMPEVHRAPVLVLAQWAVGPVYHPQVRDTHVNARGAVRASRDLPERCDHLVQRSDGQIAHSGIGSRPVGRVARKNLQLLPHHTGWAREVRFVNLDVIVEHCVLPPIHSNYNPGDLIQRERPRRICTSVPGSLSSSADMQLGAARVHEDRGQTLAFTAAIASLGHVQQVAPAATGGVHGHIHGHLEPGVPRNGGQILLL